MPEASAADEPAVTAAAGVVFLVSCAVLAQTLPRFVAVAVKRAWASSAARGRADDERTTPGS